MYHIQTVAALKVNFKVPLSHIVGMNKIHPRKLFSEPDLISKPFFSAALLSMSGFAFSLFLRSLAES